MESGAGNGCSLLFLSYQGTYNKRTTKKDTGTAPEPANHAGILKISETFIRHPEMGIDQAGQFVCPYLQLGEIPAENIKSFRDDP